MSRFFVREEDIFSGHILIQGEDVTHIRNVLRSNRGDRLTLCDGNGTDYLVEIAGMEPGAIYADIIRADKNHTEPPIEVTLFQGVPKSDKMDFIIQKSVELGIGRIVPVMTARTVVKFGSRADAENKTRRWAKIALEAAKQCNRGIVPEVETPVDFSGALELAGESPLGIVPYEKETAHSLGKALETAGAGKIAVMIGPEGGFTEGEIDSAIAHNITPVTLGPRILRTETAAIAVLSIIMHRLGDVGA